MFTSLYRHAHDRPFSRARTGGESSRPLAPVRTGTPQLLNFIACELVNMFTPTHENRFGYEHMNRQTGYRENLIALELLNPFTSELKHTFSRPHVNVFTRELGNQFQGKPDNQPSGSHGNTKRR
jgi:hypothetical protein